MKGFEDILYPLLHLYNSLPLSIRNIFGLIYRLLPKNIRSGSFYNQYVQRIEFFQDFMKDRDQLQADLLSEQLNYSKREIPFYQSLNEVKTLTDICDFPIITKETINNSPDSFLNNRLLSKAIKANTGGSSGAPFVFYIDKGITRPKEAAHFDWYWGKYGFKPGDKVLMIRGKSLRKNADYEYHTIGNKLVVSCYNMNQNSINAIHKQIHKFKPKFIHAYPSSLLTFTKELQLYLNGNKADFHIQTIFLGSEYLFDDDEQYFKSFYQSRIVTWYGHSECLIHGAKCVMSGDYHFYPFYGFVELVDENDQRIKEPGIEGRIIATGFDNKVMPLIRYDTGDIGVLSPRKECSCGFKGVSLSKIIGRGKDYIVLKDNTSVSLTALIFGQHHEEFGMIREMQIIQNEPGEIYLNIVPLKGISKDDIESLKNRLINSVKTTSLVVQIQVVEKIKKTIRGKHKLLIQNIEK